MAIAPIVPQMPDVRGEPITVAINYTAGTVNVETITLETYLPKIDISRAHPVLNVMYLSTETDLPSNSLVFTAADETVRGTTPTGAGAGVGFEVVTASTIEIWVGATDLDGIIFITYIPYGVQNA